jgi:hopanoid biosynthesis associated protein HpnK
MRDIPDLVGPDGRFSSDQMRLGIAYFFRPAVRRQLAAEIRAQFEAFRKTGLTLDHANAHKHMHLHPTVGRLIIDIGAEFGLRAIRVPAEPARGARQGFGDVALRRWCGVLRRQARRAGMVTNDHVFGLGDSGHMTPERVAALLRDLPPGLTEMYFHPATHRDSHLRSLMPEYEHEAEYRALCEVSTKGIELTSFGACGAEKKALLF